MRRSRNHLAPGQVMLIEEPPEPELPDPPLPPSPGQQPLFCGVPAPPPPPPKAPGWYVDCLCADGTIARPQARHMVASWLARANHNGRKKP